MTLYERLGGEPGVAALLEELYVRAQADPLLAPFLASTDIERLKVQQFALISQALGGPHHYSGPSLPQSHARLRIEQRHFDAFVAHLHGALRQLSAADDLAEEILSRVRPLSSVIVNTRSGTAAS